MKKRLFRLFICLFVFWCSPNLISAGGGSDDRTFTSQTGFDNNKYIYGDVTECSRGSGGLAWFEGIKTVSGKKMCLWNTNEGNESYKSVGKLKCSDSAMERYQVKVQGSDKKTYYGWGCRKYKNINDIKYEQKKLYAGRSEVVADEINYNCYILSGDAGKFGGDGPLKNKCYLVTTKPGTLRIKVERKSNLDVKYYEYTVVQAYKKKSELDNKYDYSDVKSCSIRVSGYDFSEILNFDGLKVCGYIGEDELRGAEVKCKEGYERFSLAFEYSSKTYEGYGCRKIKEQENIEYQKETIYLGESKVIADHVYNKCSIISGNAAHFDNSSIISNPCHLITDKVGTVKIKVLHNNTSVATYYEYNVIEAANSFDDFDDDDGYSYSDVKSCRIMAGSAAGQFQLGEIIDFDGKKVCVYKGYDDFPGAEVTCQKGYEKAQIAIKKGDRVYHGYACRSIPGYESDDYGDGDYDYGEPVYGCEVIPEKIREWIMDTLDLVKYVCLALVIILGVIDFIKAAASGEAEQVKKSGNSFLKRIVAVIILFLLPVIVELILNLIEIAGVDPNCFKD